MLFRQRAKLFVLTVFKDFIEKAQVNMSFKNGFTMF